MHATARLVALNLILLGVGLLHGAGGTTYLIHADGSGDFPSLQAAIDGASPGDIIEMSDGTYTGLTFRGSRGPFLGIF